MERPQNFSPARACEGATTFTVAFLVALALLLGFGLGAMLFRGTANRENSHLSPRGDDHQPALSAVTRQALATLAGPVEIRFYNLLEPNGDAASLRPYADRVGTLLSAYEAEGNGKITVRRYISEADFPAKTASEDGIQAFNLEKGAASFLGVAIHSGSAREAVPRLAPEWEQALEPDLTRIIVRVARAAANSSPAAVAAKADPAAQAEVKRVFPNLESVSLEEGTRQLRESAFDEFAQVAAEMETRVKHAQQQVADAKKVSSADLPAALENLARIQYEQTERLKDVAAKAQARLEAFRQMKSAQ